MKKNVKIFVWGMVVGMVLLLIVTFSTGLVMTSRSAKAMAHEISANAVVDRLAPISVAQFMQDPNREERLRELKEMDEWKRTEYVKKQGWAIMPGEKEAGYDVSRACGRLLMKLKI